MEQQELQSKWPQIQEKIKQEHPDVKIDDLKYEIGQEEALLLQLQQRLGKTRKEIFNWLSILG